MKTQILSLVHNWHASPRKQRCSLETLVLVSRRLEDMKNGLGLEIKVLVLVLTKKSRQFQDLNE